MSEPAPVQTAAVEELDQHVLPSPALTPLDHLLLGGVPRTVSADQDFHATVGQLFQAWENEDDFPEGDAVGKALIRGPLFALGPDGRPVHRISDGSGLNNLPGVFGGALASDDLAEVKVKEDAADLLPPKQPGSRPGSPHQNALRKRHRDEVDELQEHDAKLLQLRKMHHGDVLLQLQHEVEEAREKNNKLAEELEDCMMELRAWQEENRRVRKMLALAQNMKDAQGMRHMAPFVPPDGLEACGPGPALPPVFSSAGPVMALPARPLPPRPMCLEAGWPAGAGAAAGPLPVQSSMGPPPGRGSMLPPGAGGKGCAGMPFKGMAAGASSSPVRASSSSGGAAVPLIQEGAPRDASGLKGGAARQAQARSSAGTTAAAAAAAGGPSPLAAGPPVVASAVATPAPAALQLPDSKLQPALAAPGQNNPAALMSLLRAAMQKRRAGGEAAAAQQQQQQQQQQGPPQ